MNAYTVVLLSVIVSCGFAVGGLLLTRRVIDLKHLRASHEVSGFLIAIVSAIYAVLLGLVVVDAMQQYQRAREITERETNNLSDVYILAKGLPEPRRSQLQNMCTDYAGQVVSTEWELMRTGAFCPLAQHKAIDLMSSLMDFVPKTETEKAIFPQLLQETSQFWQNRQERIFISKKSVPGVEWVVLIAGALITIFFTFFFALEHMRLQVLMTTMIATLISLSLALLFLFAYPFSGDMAVQADPYSALQDLFGSEPGKP